MDMCHDGHLNLLREMRAQAGRPGRVIVVLHDDASVYRIKGKVPVQSIEHRVRNLQITGLVDEVLVTELVDPSDQWLRILDRWPVETLLFMRGDDNLDPPGQWLLDHFGIAQKIIGYTDGVSSTRMREALIRD